MPASIGIDLCDEYISAFSPDGKKTLTVPTMVCREKKEDIWYIGEEAYRVALSGKGVLTEKLLSLLKKQGTSTIQRKTYSARMLLSKLIGTLMQNMLGAEYLSETESLVISLKRADKGEMDQVKDAAILAGFEREKIRVISHEESFIHFMLSLDRELSFNNVGLFDLAGESLSFYRMRIARGGARYSCIAESADLEESFRIGIIKNESGVLIGDRILLDAAKKYLGNDIYSSILLTGKGFENTSWAENFIKFICKRRRVIYEDGIFAIGASLYARKLSEEKRPEGNVKTAEDSDYLIFCDTRTHESISLDVSVNERKTRLVMVSAGFPWYEVDTFAEVLPMGQKYIDIDIDPVDRAKPRHTVRLSLEEFPLRPDRCTRVSIEIRYQDLSTIEINVVDLGFGEIYPSSGKNITRILNL